MNMLSRQLKNLEGKPVTLEKEIGRGGEGAVFAIQNAPDLVAKIYHEKPQGDRADKILAMVRTGNERLLSLSTWPLAPYYSNDGTLSGFVMRRLMNNVPLFELYSPKLRLKVFPKADWRFLIHTAMNVARAFAVIHDGGHVVGDVNHGNILVAQDATVSFIDTDSFQIHSNRKYWFCEVGVLTHQPPEMQNRSFKGLLRTPNHDNFGLAVLVFQLLFMARHPFSGRFLGSGEMPLEKAILESRFAYGSDHSISQMLPPPASLPITSLTPQLRGLFERAFSKNSAGMQTGLRPTPDEWISALMELAAKLKTCSSNSAHYYFKELRKCPWCDLESASCSLFFPFIGVSNKTDFNINVIWQQVLAAKDPGPEPSPPVLSSNSCTPSIEAQAIAKKIANIKGRCFTVGIPSSILMVMGSTSEMFSYNQGAACFLFFIILLFSLVFYYSTSREVLVDKIKTQLGDMKNSWENFIAYWKAVSITGNGPSFSKIRQDLDDLKKTYDLFPREREERIQKLKRNSYDYQLLDHLVRFRISVAGIPKIGPERVATLQSYGIETAADIEKGRLLAINGIGPVFTMGLLQWRKQVEAKFVFDANKSLRNQDIVFIDSDIAIRKHKVEAELAAKASQLSSLTQQIMERRQKLHSKASEHISMYSQIIADAQEVGLQI